MSKAITLSLWMTNSKLKIDQHEWEIARAYERLKFLNTEMSNLFLLIDSHDAQIKIEEGKLAEAKRQRNELIKSNHE